MCIPHLQPSGAIPASSNADQDGGPLLPLRGRPNLQRHQGMDPRKFVSTLEILMSTQYAHEEECYIVHVCLKIAKIMLMRQKNTRVDLPSLFIPGSWGWEESGVLFREVNNGCVLPALPALPTAWVWLVSVMQTT